MAEQARRQQDPKKKRKQLRGKMDDAVKDFCRTLLLVAKAMHTKNKQDTDLAELREQLKIAIKDAPIDIFEITGEYIWNNREDVRKGNMKEFLRRDYKKEISAQLNETSEVENVQLLITKIKRTWRLFNSVEQGDLTKKIQNLLKQYAIYEGSRRELKKM